MEDQIKEFEKKKRGLRATLKELDKKCKSQLGPLNKYTPAFKEPYIISDAAEYLRRAIGEEVEEKAHLRKRCKFMSKPLRETDKEGRYYLHATDPYECKLINGVWDAQATNRKNKFDLGVCWVSEQDKTCSQKVPKEFLRSYYSKYKNLAFERMAETEKCQVIPGCKWQQETKYTWDCVKGEPKVPEKEEGPIMTPPNDMPIKEGLEGYLYRWYSSDTCPLTTELMGQGNRCKGASQADDDVEETTPGEAPKVTLQAADYIDVRILDPEVSADADKLKLHMTGEEFTMYKRHSKMLKVLGTEVFNQRFKGRSMIDVFYNRMDRKQFMEADEELPYVPPETKKKRKYKKGALYPSVPQSIVNMMMKHTAITNGDRRGMLAWHSTGSGKCHAKDTPILMFDGSIKMVQDVRVGDLLMGDDSTPRRVLSLATGEDDMYDIIPTKGDKYTVNAAHILCLKHTIKDEEDKIVQIEVKDFIKLSEHLQQQLKGYRKGVDFESRPVEFDPYIIGLWLGDGDTSKHPDTFLSVLRKLNLINNKHIPDIYKCNDRNTRLLLLAGIIDTVECYDIIQKNKRLSDDIVYLARSLGFAAYQEIIEGTYYRVSISGSDLEDIPMQVPRKKSGARKQIKDALMTGITVNNVGRGTYYGFMIDGNHRYLLGDFTVTHNTCTATGLIDAFWDTDRPIIFASSIDAIASNPDYKFHECAMNLYPRFQQAPFVGQTREESMALLAAAFKRRNVRFLTFAKLSNRVVNAEEYKKTRTLVKGASKKGDILNTEPYVDLDRAVLIMDEVHNLFRPLANQKNEHEKLEKELLDLRKHPDMKVVILTATPGDNIPDVLKLLNIIRNPKQPAIKLGDMTDPKYIQEFKDSIRGMISYFDMSSDTTKFPIVYDTGAFIKAPMSETQLQKYVEAYKSVKGDIKNFDVLARNNQMSKYWEPARKYSNMLFNFDNDMALSDFSSKMPVLLENIMTYPSHKQYVYSSFYTKMGYGGHGIVAIAKELEKKGYKKLTVADAKKFNEAKKLPRPGKRYILAITTEIGEDGGSAGKNLHELIKIYNHPANKDGQLIHVMLASQGFNEGIDLKAVRHIHFFEPLITMASDKQTLGRAARYCSHADLDRDKGEWSVNIHRYMSDMPPVKVEPDPTPLINQLNNDILVLQAMLTQEGLMNELKALKETKKKTKNQKDLDRLEKLIEKKTQEIKDAKEKIKEDIKKKQKELKDLTAPKKKQVDMSTIDNVEERIFKESRERMKELLTVYDAMKQAAVDCEILKEFHSATGNQVKCAWT